MKKDLAGAFGFLSGLKQEFSVVLISPIVLFFMHLLTLFGAEYFEVPL